MNHDFINALEKKYSLNIDYDDCSGMYFVYRYHNAVGELIDRCSVELQYNCTLEELEAAAKNVHEMATGVA